MQQSELRVWLAAIRSGDKAAFTALYDALSQPVFAIACRITGQRETAEDLTQEVFLRLWQSPPDESVRNPRAYIFQCTRNLALDALRRQQPLPLPETLPDESDPIGAALLRDAVSEAMRTLTPAERETVTLHADGGLRFREIAALTGSTVSSVYRTYRRALKKLRCALSPDERSDES